jgi:hypothetical protein
MEKDSQTERAMPLVKDLRGELASPMQRVKF